MLAPVYRSLEARSTVLGLAFPAEFTIVLSSWWAGMLALGPFSGLLVAAATYALVRLVNYGRADGFVQHFLQWKVRQVLHAGRLSAAARVAPGRARPLPGHPDAPTSPDLAARADALAIARSAR
jgi:hypothetical protein